MKFSKNLFIKLLLALFIIIGLFPTHAIAATNETIKALQGNFVFLFISAIIAAMTLGVIVNIIEFIIKKCK